MMKGVVASTTSTEPLYLFESPAQNKTFVIVKGSYNGVMGYHKLDLLTSDKKAYLDITRNYQYIVHITKISTVGYSTADEAIQNEASNRDIEYNITVTDPSSHDIITNGEQYLGVSNSSLIIYQTDGMSNFVATKLSYTTANNWQSGSITATGDGLSLSNGQKTMTLPNTGSSDQEIGINITSGFSVGALTIRIGDLCKVIDIKRYKNLAAVPDEMEFEQVTIGDCSESKQKDLIRFSEESGRYDVHALDEVFVSTTQKYMLL